MHKTKKQELKFEIKFRDKNFKDFKIGILFYVMKQYILKLMYADIAERYKGY